MNRPLCPAGLASTRAEGGLTIDPGTPALRCPIAGRRPSGSWRSRGAGAVRLHLAVVLWLASGIGAAQVVIPPTVGVPPRAETAPPAGHDLALAALAGGDHASALDLANACYRGASRIGAERWIDSIAAAALVGECLFERGDFRGAVAAFEEAMLLQAGHGDWLLAVQFPPPAAQPPRQRVATWGRSGRNTMPGSWPEVATIRIRGADPQEVLQRGGTLTAPYDRSLRPQEIMRCLVIAIYRHAVLLGELGRDNGSLDAVAKALGRRPAPPNHHSQAWIDIALGTACWAQGKVDVAQPLLVRGLVAGNEFDHPLTAWGLIVLGRIALDADQAARAATLFEEASYAAADFGDARALEESMRLAFQAHRAAGVRGVPPSIRGCSEWAGRPVAALEAGLLAAEAEGLAAAGDPRSAAAALRRIDGRLLRADGAVAAAAAYAAALVEYAAADMAAGAAELDRALMLARGREPRLFQTTLVTELVRGGSGPLSDRQADVLLGRLLADPAARDFAIDPLGTLAVMSAPRGEAFEAWVDVARRRGDEAGLDAAEAAVRGRWLALQPLGGRRLAMAGFLLAEQRLLPPADAARRAAVIAGQPGLAGLLDRIGQLRGTLAAALPDGGRAEDWKEYQAAAARLQQVVATAAAGRDPAPLGFPPLTTAAEIRRRLAPRQLLLSFHWTATGLWGALESRERFTTWQVRQVAGLPGEVETLARALGLVDPVKPVTTEQLLEGDWSGSADRIERMLFENSRITLAEGIDELVVVPDGWLWYVPFEILPVATNRAGAGAGERRRLHDVCRIRYCPTRSLAVMTFDPRPGRPIGAVAGRMFPRDPPAAADEAVAGIAATIDDVVPIAAANGPRLELAASVCDTLLVLDELPADGARGGRSLVAGGAGRAGVPLAEWLGLPLRRPQRVLLPGLQTAMARGFARPPERPGDEVFVTATDLLAAGSHTAVLGRWRVGGKSCVDLMTEFLRGVTAPRGGDGPLSAAGSWQRAVDRMMAEHPDPAREPRLKQGSGPPLPDGRHPFLWAGYVLVDCGSGAEPAPAQDAGGPAAARVAPAPARAAP